MCFGEEVVGVDTCGQHGCDLAHIRIRFDGCCQNHHIRFFQDLTVVQKVRALNQQLAVGLGNDLSDLALDVIHSILFHRSSVELVKVLARCTDIDIEYGHIHIRIFVADQHRMLCGVHTADLGAVRFSSVVGAAASHALDKYDLLRRLSVRETL